MCSNKLSRAEEITSEVRRLVLTCRTLEAQLQQSIPKKTHAEVVAKMQGTIDSLGTELAHSKAELERTISLGERLNALSNQISAQSETISSQIKQMDSLGENLSKNTVPYQLYCESLSKIQELEERVQCMVERTDYSAVQSKVAQLEEQILAMVPRAQYSALEIELANSVPKSQFEEAQRTLSQSVPLEQLNVAAARIAELEKTLSTMVPVAKFEEIERTLAQSVPREQLSKAESEIAELRTTLANSVPAVQLEEAQKIISERVPKEKLAAAEARIVQLERDLANSVPRSDFDELTGKIASLTREASAVASSIAAVMGPASELIIEAAIKPVVETVLPTSTSSQTATSSVEAPAKAPEAAQSTQEILVTQIVAAAPSSQPIQNTTPAQEISEVQSQLSEIRGAEQTGATTMISPQAPSVEVTRGFKFVNTEFCATSGVEFLQDLEQISAETLDQHSLNGDFERWFKEVLADESSAESLKALREANCSGEELRTKMIAVIAPKYRN